MNLSIFDRPQRLTTFSVFYGLAEVHKTYPKRCDQKEKDEKTYFCWEKWAHIFAQKKTKIDT